MNNEALQQHAHIHAINAMLDISGVSKDEQLVTLQEVNEQADELENPTMSASLRESVVVQGMFDNLTQFPILIARLQLTK